MDCEGPLSSIRFKTIQAGAAFSRVLDNREEATLANRRWPRSFNRGPTMTSFAESTICVNKDASSMALLSIKDTEVVAAVDTLRSLALMGAARVWSCSDK